MPFLGSMAWNAGPLSLAAPQIVRDVCNMEQTSAFYRVHNHAVLVLYGKSKHAGASTSPKVSQGWLLDVPFQGSFGPAPHMSLHYVEFESAQHSPTHITCKLRIRNRAQGANAHNEVHMITTRFI